MSNPYYIFLDDERLPKDVKWVDLPPYPYTVIRNYANFVALINQLGLPKFISFDHDLGLEHYDDANKRFQLMIDKDIDYSQFKEKTGYHCAQYLIGYCTEYKLSLPEYLVHSQNPVGKANILSLLSGFKQFQRENQK